MTDLVPLTTRQLPTNGTVMPAPAASVLGSMPEKLQMANALAAHCHEFLPKAYHGKPGACLMLIDYCERNDLTLFEAGSEVSFNRGRSSVSARLQKKLAARVGFRTVKVEGDDESCTVAVIAPDGKEVGRATYTYATAEALGIIYERDGQTLKSTWRGDRAQMLFHRATTRALDHYGPSEYAWAFRSPDQVADDVVPDPLDVLAPATPEPPASTAPEPATVEATDGDGQAERLAHLVATAAVVDVKDASVLKEANRLAREAGASPVPDLASLAEPERADLYDAVLDWLGEK